MAVASTCLRLAWISGFCAKAKAAYSSTGRGPARLDSTGMIAAATASAEGHAATDVTAIDVNSGSRMVCEARHPKVEAIKPTISSQLDAEIVAAAPRNDLVCTGDSSHGEPRPPTALRIREAAADARVGMDDFQAGSYRTALADHHRRSDCPA
jgi:hypothetical protein